MALRPRLVAVLLGVAVSAPLLPGPTTVTLIALDAVVLAAAVLDLLLAPSPSVLVRERRHSEVVSVGRPLDVELVLRGGRRRTSVDVRDAVAPSLRPDPERLRLVLGEGGGVGRYSLRPTRRGRFTLGPTTIRASGPLGLVARQGDAPVTTSVKVYPPLRARLHVEARLRRQRSLEHGARSALVRGGGTEFESLRDYHPDDDHRRINWAATARAARAISNVYREERNQYVLLLHDAGRAMATTVEGAPRFEHALDAGIGLATLSERVGDRVGAFAFAEKPIVSTPPRTGRDQAARVAEALYHVQARPVASDYRGAIAHVLGRFGRRAMVVLFTDLADESASEALLAVLPALARRHLVMVVEVCDPEVERLAASRPVDERGAYRKAAAAGAIARRDGASSRLRRLGAVVVDRPPGTVVGAALDEYLRAKAYGRL